MMLHQCHESPAVILAKARVVVVAAAVMVVELSQDQLRKNQKEDLAEDDDQLRAWKCKLQTVLQI